MDLSAEDSQKKINIADREDIQKWSRILNCTERDLKEAVFTIGCSVKIVNDFLILNRKKID